MNVGLATMEALERRSLVARRAKPGAPHYKWDCEYYEWALTEAAYPAMGWVVECSNVGGI